MQIIFYKKDKVYRIINTDVCADFRNENFEITYQHGNYRHTMSTEDIGNTQEILDYIAYCLKEKKEVCEVPSKDYEDWKSRLYISEEDLKKLYEEVNKVPLTPIILEGNDYIATYHGVPIEELQKAYEELQKAYEESALYKEYKEIIDKWTEAGFINPITSEEIKKIKEQEKKDKKDKTQKEKVKEIWANYNNAPIRTPHCGHKISDEEREEAIKRAIAKAYLFDKKDKK